MHSVILSATFSHYTFSNSQDLSLQSALSWSLCLFHKSLTSKKQLNGIQFALNSSQFLFCLTPPHETVREPGRATLALWKQTSVPSQRSLGGPHSRSGQAVIQQGILIDWLWWGETDVSELRPLRAYCSSPGDWHMDHGMMVSTGVNS
jgi:hypothetical protein